VRPREVPSCFLLLFSPVALSCADLPVIPSLTLLVVWDLSFPLFLQATCLVPAFFCIRSRVLFVARDSFFYGRRDLLRSIAVLEVAVLSLRLRSTPPPLFSSFLQSAYAALAQTPVPSNFFLLGSFSPSYLYARSLGISSCFFRDERGG